MNTFIPQHLSILLYTICLILFTGLAGFAIARIRNYKTAILLAWILVASVTLLMERIIRHEGGGFRMLALIMTALFSMKAVVAVESYQGKSGRLNIKQWLAFLGWFGMRPQLFENVGGKPLSGYKELIYLGISRAVLGVILLFMARYLMLHGSDHWKIFLSTGLTLAGLSLILHFGILNISAGLWRLSGVDTRTLFKAPLLSTTLTEFWGKRWNLAFSEMTALGVYRPVKKVTGITVATMIAFLVSGLLHELAISVSVKKGIGLPMLYFLLHGLLMLAEKKMADVGYAVNSNKWIGRLWVMTWLVVPAPLLFHKYFLQEIIWPIMGLV